VLWAACHEQHEIHSACTATILLSRVLDMRAQVNDCVLPNLGEPSACTVARDHVQHQLTRDPLAHTETSLIHSEASVRVRTFESS
jgi:hypothetical protein